MKRRKKMVKMPRKRKPSPKELTMLNLASKLGKKSKVALRATLANQSKMQVVTMG